MLNAVRGVERPRHVGSSRDVLGRYQVAARSDVHMPACALLTSINPWIPTYMLPPTAHVPSAAVSCWCVQMLWLPNNRAILTVISILRVMVSKDMEDAISDDDPVLNWRAQWFAHA